MYLSYTFLAEGNVAFGPVVIVPDKLGLVYHKPQDHYTTLKSKKYLNQLLFVTVLQPSSHKNFNWFFLAQLIAILNSYPHSMSPIARLKWSAFLRGGFMAL